MSVPTSAIQLLLLVSCLVVAACGRDQRLSIPVSSGPSSSGSGTPIFSMDLVTEEVGWVLTGAGLLRTTDGGNSWTDMTPSDFGPQFSPENLPTVYFPSASVGWAAMVVGPVGAPTIVVVQTSTGGRDWSLLTIDDFPKGQLDGIRKAFFLSAETGWMMVDFQSPDLEGGGLLIEIPEWQDMWLTPSVDSFTFSTTLDGWIAGGEAGGQLFATHDGGTTWEEQPVPNRLPTAPWLTTVAVPRFFDEFSGVLPVQVRSDSEADTGEVLSEEPEDFEDTSVLHFHLTSDGGRTWLPGVPLRVSGGGTFLEADARGFSVVDRSTWFLVVADTLRVTRDGGLTWATVTSNRGLGDVGSIDFASPTEGWATFERFACPNKELDEESDCTKEAGLLGTVDGGQTWTDVTP